MEKMEFYLKLKENKDWFIDVPTFQFRNIQFDIELPPSSELKVTQSKDKGLTWEDLELYSEELELSSELKESGIFISDCDCDLIRFTTTKEGDSRGFLAVTYHSK